MTDDIDIDDQDDLDSKSSPQQKPSLKEAWESNPLMKLAAVVLGAAVLAGGWFTMMGGEDTTKDISVVRSSPESGAKQAPGQKDLDQVYQVAIEEANKQRAEEAGSVGGSALPTPIGTGKGQLEAPEAPDMKKSDPLQEWRQKAEERRMLMEEETTDDDGAGEQPEIVPMVQPIRPQTTIQADPNAARALSEQMRVIIAAQAPLKSAQKSYFETASPYMEVLDIRQEEKEHRKKMRQEARTQELDSISGKGDAAGGNGGAAAKDAKSIITAGTISYAQLLTELNSDIEGPALAQILSGPLQGGRALGKMKTKDEYIVIEFSRVVKDGVSYVMNGVALDEKTTLAGQATDIDHHYLTRVILPAAAKFVEGYGKAVAETGTSTTTTAGGGVASNNPAPTTKEELYKGAEEATKKISEIFDQNAERPITVKIAKGTTMGILFLDPVTTKDIEQ